MENYFYFDFPIGPLGISENGTGISQVFLKGKGNLADSRECLTDILKVAAEQLDEYFGGERQNFDVPLSVKGTDFQKKVWQALLAIPYGQTRCYSEVAAMVGNPKASRAVGMANHHNPLMILVPCHRVVGKDGSLTGYAGGLDVKRYLLNLESKYN